MSCPGKHERLLWARSGQLLRLSVESAAKTLQPHLYPASAAQAEALHYYKNRAAQSGRLRPLE